MRSKPSKMNGRHHGFTLVELWVAITILTMILLALGSAMVFVTRIWINEISSDDNFTKIRVILNIPLPAASASY